MAAELLGAEDTALASSPTLADARATVAGFDPGDDHVVRGHHEALLAFVDAHPDALHRTCVEGHLTGSAWVMNAAGDRGLLMLHAKLGMWLQPGGHADGDANLAAVALREATEETGIDGLRIDPVPLDVDIHRVAPPSEHPHLHHDVRFLVIAPSGAIERGNHESRALRWVTLDEVADLATDASTLRLARAGFARAAARPR